MAINSMTWTLLLVLLSTCLLALVAAQTPAPETSPVPEASPSEPAPSPTAGGGGGDLETILTPALDLQNGFKLTDDGTGFIASHGNSKFTIRLTCLREVGKGGGGAVQEAALALGQKQVIRPQAPWDPDLESVYSEFSQNVGIAKPEGAVFNWNIKSFIDKYHMEAVPGSKQFIALLPGNVKANIQIEWPVKSYLNGFQVCTEVTWDIADEDFYLFMNNNTLPGQKKNLTAEPTVSYTVAKDSKGRTTGFTLNGPYTFAYLWPGRGGFTFLSKNPYAKSGEPNFANLNVTLNKASWTQKGSVEVVVTSDRAAEKIMLDPLMDIEGGWASGLLPNLALLLAVLFSFASLAHLL